MQASLPLKHKRCAVELPNVLYACECNITEAVLLTRRTRRGATAEPGHAQGSRTTSEDCYRQNTSSYKRLGCIDYVFFSRRMVYPLRSGHVRAEL